MRINKALTVFLFIAAVYLLFCNGHYGGDGLESYLTAESLVIDHDVVIHDRPFGVNEMHYAVRGHADTGGRHYSQFGIGMPLILVPFYALGNLVARFITQVPHDYITQFFVSLSNPIISALTAATLFIFLGRLGYSQRTRLLTVLCYSFATMNAVYARTGFSEPMIGLLVLLSVFYLYKYERSKLATDLILAGVLISYTVLIKSNCLLYAALFLAYVFLTCPWRLSIGSSMRQCLCTIPVFLFIFAYFVYQSMIYGDITSPVKTVGERGFIYGGKFIKALYYYLFSPGKGFIFYNLPLVLSLFGMSVLLKKEKKLSAYLIAFILVNFLYYSYHFQRGSIFCWGPRYMYPVVIACSIFLAEFIENAGTAARKLSLAVFSLAGFAVQLPCFFVNMSDWILFVKEKLLQQEYIINFVPDLSPIAGCWYLFISSVKRMLTGVSLEFIYDPDSLFAAPVASSLSGHDTWDVWWTGMLKVCPALLPVVLTVAVILAVTASVTFCILIKRTARS
jgi:hypothetical protein